MIKPTQTYGAHLLRQYYRHNRAQIKRTTIYIAFRVAQALGAISIMDALSLGEQFVISPQSMIAVIIIAVIAIILFQCQVWKLENEETR